MQMGPMAAAAPTVSGPLRRIRELLPEGRTLPDEAFAGRHRVMLILLLLQALGLAIFGVVQGYGAVHTAEHVAGVAGFAGLAHAFAHRRRVAAALVSLGMVTASALLVHIWDGHIEGHFLFFVVIVVLALYEDWLPFLLAAAYVVIHHGVAGAIDPAAVYNHGDAVAHPWKWALIHGAFVTAAGAASVATWRLNEAARTTARENEERFRRAFECAPIGMTLTAVDGPNAGRFIQVNRAACEMMGRSEEWLLGHGFPDISHPDDLDDTRAEIARLMNGEIDRCELEKRYVHADGHVLWANTVVTLLDSVPGSPRARIAQIQDVTEKKRSADEMSYQALHDQLTGLPNRRSLFIDLEQQLAEATAERPLTVALFDLDGFKAYNDTFGHPAGDVLLARLGAKLAAGVRGRASAYRMGGDEFCVLGWNGVESIAEMAASALVETGEGFEVTVSYGAVSLPDEAATPEEALRIADQRMYARKSLDSRASAGRQTTNVLLKVLSERNPELGIHLDEVSGLCEAVGRRLGLPDDEIAPLLQAACLHDVGKAAVPDEILHKPGPLDDEEWAFMRRHTVIGERILASAPALARAAKLVRWSHESYDGGGYPDGLGGGDIPLGARIIAVCDAYDAMTADRPYRAAMSSADAVAELERCAGGQFDPTVVAAVCEVLGAERAAAA
jgi:diguanylate cyclase (GGDEF)-like protein/PAS domain S-box-containing protein